MLEIHSLLDQLLRVRNWFAIRFEGRLRARLTGSIAKIEDFTKPFLQKSAHLQARRDIIGCRGFGRWVTPAAFFYSLLLAAVIPS